MKMKQIKLINLIVIGLALTFVIAGCKKTPGPITPLPGRAGKAPKGPGPGAIIEPGKATGAEEGPSGIALRDERGHIGWQEDTTAFDSETVYFDFDSSAIKSSERSKIEKVASYLKEHSAHAVKIEGHCDERGTEEYNRALGERRALAIREYLVHTGISPDRIETISYGEDRPVDPGHNEEAWRKNRRGVFILLTPPK